MKKLVHFFVVLNVIGLITLIVFKSLASISDGFTSDSNLEIAGEIVGTKDQIGTIIKKRRRFLQRFCQQHPNIDKFPK